MYVRFADKNLIRTQHNTNFDMKNFIMPWVRERNRRRENPHLYRSQSSINSSTLKYCFNSLLSHSLPELIIAKLLQIFLSRALSVEINLWNFFSLPAHKACSYKKNINEKWKVTEHEWLYGLFVVLAIGFECRESKRARQKHNVVSCVYFAN